MEQLSLFRCLEISPPSVISFYGAGGKTTLSGRLGAEMAAAGQKVLLTTTTKIYPYQDLPLICTDDVKRASAALKEHYKQHNLAVLGRRIMPNGKVEGIDPAAVDELFEKLMVSIIIEADGAGGKPIKGYAEYEPVIPACSDLIVPVIGADALLLTLTPANVHRLPQLLQATGSEEGEAITENLVARTYIEMLTLGHSQAPRSTAICLLNKADLLETVGPTALKIDRILADESTFARFIITRADDRNPVKINLSTDALKPAVNVSCVILAAGKSSRMGFDKLSLILDGKTILEHTLESIIKAGIEDIIVVTQPNSRWPKVIGKHNCKIIENQFYERGLSSSLKAGLEAVEGRAQGLLFALADQPRVLPDTFKMLINSYRQNLKLLTCPLYLGQRGNPTIFDRRTWPDLLKISNDQGGRALFNKIDESETDLVETADPAVISDIDTPEQYRQLLNKKRNPLKPE